MRSVILLATGFALLAASSEMPTEPQIWNWVRVGSELSALGALIAAFAYLLRVEIPASRKQNQDQQEAFGKILDRITDRWDGWEKIRHEDHESLQNVIRETVGNCAETRAVLLEATDKAASRAHDDAERAHDDADKAHNQNRRDNP